MESIKAEENKDFEIKEKFFWADQVADEIIKEKGKRNHMSVHRALPPSGTVHMGNFREVITTDLITRH